MYIKFLNVLYIQPNSHFGFIQFSILYPLIDDNHQIIIKLTPMEAIDRISFLPDDLTHHIMSLLPMKDIARTSILLKRWMSHWLCFPVQEFDESWFKGRRESCGRDFHEYLRRSLARRDFDNMQELKIITYSQIDHELKHLITRFVAKEILRGKLQKLDLHVRDHVGNSLCDHYALPRVIFSSGSFLVSLTIRHCKIGAYQKVSLPLLQNMKLISVHVTNYPLERVIRNCPDLETLTLEYCHGFDTLKLFNPSVRRLVVRGCMALQGFEMDAPRLNYFQCSDIRDFDEAFVYRPDHFCCRFLEFKVTNENSMSSLETLVFSFMVLNDRTFESALSKFSNLETLKLLSSVFGKLPSSLSSAILKKLKLVRMENCRFDGPVEIHSPNLETFVYKAGHGEIASFHFGGRGFGNIKTLAVNGFLGLRNKSLEELISACILLENLYLNSCAIPKGHLEIYSLTLKTLVVHGCDHLHFSEIQAPQLLYFQYVGQLENFPTLNFAPCDLDADLLLVSKPSIDIDYAQLINFV